MVRNADRMQVGYFSTVSLGKGAAGINNHSALSIQRQFLKKSALSRLNMKFSNPKRLKQLAMS